MLIRLTVILYVVSSGTGIGRRGDSPPLSCLVLPRLLDRVASPGGDNAAPWAVHRRYTDLKHARWLRSGVAQHLNLLLTTRAAPLAFVATYTFAANRFEQRCVLFDVYRPSTHISYISVPLLLHWLASQHTFRSAG